MNKKASTLIEVCLVLTALIIMLSFSVTMLIRRPQDQLTACLKAFQSELIFLQQKAVSANKKLTVTFFPEENRYAVFQGEKPLMQKLTKNFIFSFISGAQGPPSKPNHSIMTPIKFEGPNHLAAIIHPNGKMSSGTVYITDHSRTRMGAITIVPHQFAHIRMYTQEKGRWQILSS